MDKKPWEMNSEELFIRMEKDGVNTKAAQTLREAKIDGKLLWLMVEDFNEFSIIVTNPVERLHLKQFVKVNSITNLKETAQSENSGSNNVIEAKFVNTHSTGGAQAISAQIDSESDDLNDDDDVECQSRETMIADSPVSDSPKSKKRSLEPCDSAPLAKRTEQEHKQVHINAKNIRLPETFSRRVSAAIASGQLVAEDRSAFVRECVDFLEPILPTPSKEQFSEISQRLCDKYPSLRDAKKTIYWATLKGQLSQRYRNNRRRTPATTSHKIVVACTGESSQSLSLPTNVQETQEHEENVDALKKLSKTKSPAAQTVQDLLKATRERRQQWISTAIISLHQIFEKYPVLGNPKWLLYEFNSLEEKDMLETMKTNWKRVCEKLGDSDSIIYEEEKKVIQKVERNVYHRKGISPIVIEEACGDIDDHFKSKISEPRLVIFEDDETVIQMFIAGENDNLMELSASTIGEGMVYLMAAYYVFDVEYPKSYQPLLYFIQDFLMDKVDSRKRPTRYSSFAATITL